MYNEKRCCAGLPLQLERRPGSIASLRRLTKENVCSANAGDASVGCTHIPYVVPMYVT